jgi:hypothetical protein
MNRKLRIKFASEETMDLSCDRLRGGGGCGKNNDDDDGKNDAINKRNKLYAVRKICTSSSVVQIPVSNL